MQRLFARSLALAGALILSAASAPAREVEIPFSNLALTGNLALAEGKSPADGVVLITHGTLAHGRTEITQSLQDLLREGLEQPRHHPFRWDRPPPGDV